MPKNFAKNSLLILAIAIIYFVSAKIGLKSAFINASATAVWPPTGIALASLLIFGYKVWPAIFIGAFFANLTTAGTVLTSLGIAGGNTLEGIVGAFLINKFGNGRDSFEEPKDIFRFALLGGVVACMVSATIGVTALSLGGLANSNDFSDIWLTWWMGDLGGALIVAPLIIIWSNPWKFNWTLYKVFEASCLLFTLILTSVVIFFGGGRYPIDFLIFPVLLWAAFRFDLHITVVATFILSVIATWGTLSGQGPYSRNAQNESLLLLQSFMTVVTTTKLIVASIVEKSRQVDKLKNEFVSMASHELRTPMAAIKGLVAMIRAGRYGEIDEQQRQPLKNISISVEGLILLTNDLLDVARIESGRLKPNIINSPSDGLIEEIVSELSPIAKQKEVEITIDRADKSIVQMDQSYIRQILHNLLGNALKFTDHGNVTIWSEASEAVQKIYITDTGIGVPIEDHQKIFNKFQQLTTGSKRPPGTGLGLYISRELAKKMGGSLELVSSTPSKNTTFVLSLPLSKSNLKSKNK